MNFCPNCGASLMSMETSTTAGTHCRNCGWNTQGPAPTGYSTMILSKEQVLGEMKTDQRIVEVLTMLYTRGIVEFGQNAKIEELLRELWKEAKECL